MKPRNWTAVDDTLNASFPASDPPAWNAGSQKARDARKDDEAARMTPPSPAAPKIKEKPKRIRIGPSDVT